ncbi:MAG: hypothetical protein JO019_00075 [Candidatus Kaiserbacteria bacterium]|nr:hypothetical protein [Candidatus Kaiserbacteria bacterium]
MKLQSIGLEAEGWTGVRRAGVLHPVDVEPIANRWNAKSGVNGYKPVGLVTREPGLGSIEFAGKEATSISGAVAHILELDRRIRSDGLDIVYAMASPYDQHHIDPEVTTGRYRALWEAARRELRALYKEEEVQQRLARMGYLNSRAALHMHLCHENGVSVANIDNRIIFLLDVLNFLGPRLARILCRHYSVDNTGHLITAWGWGDRRRFCRDDLWYTSFEDFLRQYSSLKRMMRPVGELNVQSGDWEVDLESPMEWGNEIDGKTGHWPLARARWQFGTTEIRLLPSWPLESLEEVVNHVVGFCDLVLSVAPATIPDTLEACRSTKAWREITSYSIVGKTIPADYNSAMWHEDVFH